MTQAMLDSPRMAVRPRRTRTLVAIAVVVLLLAVGSVLLVRAHLGSAPQVGRLPPDARNALYQRTLEDLRLCATHEAVLGDHCKEQASFIVLFPECDATCRGLAARWGTAPSR